jgi:Flp pilus assembly pilin Flp
MIACLKKLVKDEGGQDLAEYGIALLVIGVGVSFAAILIGVDVTTLWTTAQGVISIVASP